MKKNAFFLEKIKKISSDTSQKWIMGGFVFLMTGFPMIQYIFRWKLKSEFQGILLTILLFYFFFFWLVELVNKRISIREHPIVWSSLAVLALAGAVSVFVANNKQYAFYGTPSRTEGLMSLLSYYMIFLAALCLKNRKYRRILLLVFLAFGTVVSVTGCLQFFNVLTVYRRYSGMAFTPMENPNFYASFAVLFAGIANSGFLFCRKDGVFFEREARDSSLPRREDSAFEKIGYRVAAWLGRHSVIVWYALSVCAFVACISASSSSAYVGLIMIFLMLAALPFLTKKKNYGRIFILLFTLAVIMVCMDFISGGRVFKEFFSVGEQIAKEDSLFGDSVGSHRMGAWKQIISLLPEYGLFGCGIENLGHLYIDHFGYYYGVYFDRAHNEYLHIWITQGIFALTAYLTILFSIFIPGHLQFSTKGKYESDDVSKMAFIAFFGYIAQAFFNISVIQVAPYFWMMCGLILAGIRRKETGSTEGVV